LLDEYDQVTGAVGAFWDLTREKAAEISRESFLTMVAHQMRNPLTSLISALELLEDAKLSHKRRGEMREAVRSQAERLREFSHHFLHMQKTLVSLPDVKWQTLAIGPIVQELVTRFEAEHGTHRFDVKICEPAPLIYADSTYVDNILCNLLDNAVSYSPEGSRVSVQVCGRDDLGMIDVTVRDEGPGISITDQAHIFEAFYRAQQPEGPRAYGHGLGLYIALEMARRIDAKIDLESEEYRGSTFHLILRRSA
jgi:K+-sensing histidine kinase KdpD